MPVLAPTSTGHDQLMCSICRAQHQMDLQQTVAGLRDLLADVAFYLDRSGVAADIAPELLARIRAAVRSVP